MNFWRLWRISKLNRKYFAEQSRTKQNRTIETCYYFEAIHPSYCLLPYSIFFALLVSPSNLNNTVMNIFSLFESIYLFFIIHFSFNQPLIYTSTHSLSYPLTHSLTHSSLYHLSQSLLFFSLPFPPLSLSLLFSSFSISSLHLLLCWLSFSPSLISFSPFLHSISPFLCVV